MYTLFIKKNLCFFSINKDYKFLLNRAGGQNIAPECSGAK
jgi:hypothetical protein